MQHSHRAGSLKQVNKTHKQAKNSKRSIKVKAGGRTEKIDRMLMKEKLQNRKDRSNLQRQIRDNKRKEFMDKKKCGAGTAYPSIVAIIPMAENIDSRTLMKQILETCSDCNVRYSSLGKDGYGQPVTIVVPKVKSRFTFMCCTQNLEQVLDVCKVADYCVFACNAIDGEENMINPQTDLILTSLRSQGLPTSFGMVQGLEQVQNVKSRQSLRKYATRLFQSELGMDVKIFDDTHIDALLRGISETLPQTLHWRQIRPYLLGEEVEVMQPSFADAAAGTQDLVIRGYLHGSPLSVYDYLHLTSESTHHAQCISILSDPSPLKQTHGNISLPPTITPIPSRVVPITPEPQIDPNSIKQPQWGTPQFQNSTDTVRNTEAIWREVVGDELYEDEEDRRQHEELMHLDDDLDDASFDDFDAMDAEEFNRQTHVPKGVSLSGDHLEFASFLEEQRKQEEIEYSENPDYFDVPYDQSARSRFIKYRGLQSFRSSPWDPKENLPIEYASLFNFEDFSGMQKNVSNFVDDRNSAENGWTHQLESGETVTDDLVPVGSFIEIRIAGVSSNWICNRSLDAPVLCSALLPHEEKRTVMHGNLVRSSSWFDETVRSRDLFMVQLGFRRELVRPIFADAGIQCDKCKYIKYVPPTGFCTAVFYAPLCYRPTPLLLFKPRGSFAEGLRLVGTGSVLKASTDTVVLKKAVLTGSPFKVRRKLATVRHMFLDPQDVLWFKPVELHTKLGCVGHIREPLGTHGYMKCIFNEQVTMQDEVRLTLWKRIYPHKVTEEEKQMYV